MKTLYTIKVVIAILLFSISQSFSQIVITTDNMPDPGDTVRVSETTMLNLPDPSQTGFDYVWDYSGLEPSSQMVLEFMAPNQTPPLYQIVFNSNVTNLASPVQNIDFLEFDITNAYEYYKNTSFQYTRAGFAVTLGSIPVPLKYSLPEVLYKFPLSVNSTPDSSLSEIEIQYPGFGYFDHLKKRVNHVDGSGSLTTPYGTFNTIRTKSVIYERDSTFIDSLQVGVPIIRNIIEYKWLSPDFHVPLLTITSEGPVYTVQYIDSVRNVIPLNVDLGNDITICEGESITLTAQAVGGEPPYSFVWSNLETTSSITVAPTETTTYIVSITDQNQNMVYDEIVVSVVPFTTFSLGNDTSICAEHAFTYTVTGIYDLIAWYVDDKLRGTGSAISIDTTGIGLGSVTIRVSYQQGTCTGSDEVVVNFQLCNGLADTNPVALTISPNPANNAISIDNGNWKEPVIRIINMAGIEVKNFTYTLANGRILMDIGDVNKGVYSVWVSENGIYHCGKLVVQ